MDMSNIIQLISKLNPITFPSIAAFQMQWKPWFVI